jgi:hypothetical protein
MCVGAFPEGLDDLREKKGRLEEAKELQEASGEGNPGTPARGAEGLDCGAAQLESGCGTRNQ